MSAKKNAIQIRWRGAYTKASRTPPPPPPPPAPSLHLSPPRTSAHASRQIPVTRHDTFAPARPVRITNTRSRTSHTTFAHTQIRRCPNHLSPSTDTGTRGHQCPRHCFAPPFSSYLPDRPAQRASNKLPRYVNVVTDWTSPSADAANANNPIATRASSQSTRGNPPQPLTNSQPSWNSTPIPLASKMKHG